MISALEARLAREDEDDDPMEDDGQALRQGRDLEKEARSLRHLLSHSPRNPHCQVCNEAVLNNKAKRKGAVIELQ